MIPNQQLSNPMTSLSPESQAVIYACNAAVERLPLSAKPEQFSIVLIATALRSAMDQIVPEDDLFWKLGRLKTDLSLEAMRNKILAIAEELETFQ